MIFRGRLRAPPFDLRSPVELDDPVDDRPLLLSRQLGVDRQRDDLLTGPFRHREISLSIPELREALLQVQGDRVVDRVADLFRGEVLAQRVAPLDPQRAAGEGLAPERLDAAFELVARAESELVEPLLAFLRDHPRVRIVGEPTADADLRVPTVCFTVDGLPSRELVRRTDARKLALRHGHFYAPAALEALGIEPEDGIVRASLVHTNTPEEVERLRTALEAELGPTRIAVTSSGGAPA